MVRLHRNLVKGELPSSSRPWKHLSSLYCHSTILGTQQDSALCWVSFAFSTWTLRFFLLPDDPLLCLLHLWTHWRHPEFSVPPGSDKEDLFPLSSAPHFHVSCVHWDWRLHPLFVAHLSTGQLWTEEDVLRKGAFIASLAWNGWESESCTFSSHCCHVMKTAVKSRWLNMQLYWEFEELDCIEVWSHWTKNRNLLFLSSLQFWVHLFST